MDSGFIVALLVIIFAGLLVRFRKRVQQEEQERKIREEEQELLEDCADLIIESSQQKSRPGREWLAVIQDNIGGDWDCFRKLPEIRFKKVMEALALIQQKRQHEFKKILELEPQVS